MNLETLQRGIELFNQGQYYEAHETLEDYWNGLESGRAKQTVQGIIQCSAALHLLQQDRIVGAQKVWARAQKNFIDKVPVDNIDLDKLIQDMSKILVDLPGKGEINVKIALR